jgi:hypothetical protein
MAIVRFVAFNIRFYNFIPRFVKNDFISTFQIVKFISDDKFLHSSINNSFIFISHQFRALSDQLYNTPDNHKFVRRKVVNQVCCLANYVSSCSLEL